MGADSLSSHYLNGSCHFSIPKFPNGRSKGFGFVEFENEATAIAAVASIGPGQAVSRPTDPPHSEPGVPRAMAKTEWLRLRKLFRAYESNLSQAGGSRQRGRQAGTVLKGTPGDAIIQGRWSRT